MMCQVCGKAPTDRAYTEPYRLEKKYACFSCYFTFIQKKNSRVAVQDRELFEEWKRSPQAHVDNRIQNPGKGGIVSKVVKRFRR